MIKEISMRMTYFKNHYIRVKYNIKHNLDYVSICLVG